MMILRYPKLPKYVTYVAKEPHSMLDLGWQLKLSRDKKLIMDLRLAMCIHRLFSAPCARYST